MKKITFMMIAMIAFFIPKVKAQHQVLVDASALHCPVKITLYTLCTDPNVKNPSHCAQDGASIELTIMPGSVFTYDPATAPWAPGGDPTVVSPYWAYNEAGVGATCESGTGPIIGGCVPNVTRVGTPIGSCAALYPSTSCFYFTSASCGCSMGSVVNVSLSVGGPGLILTLY